MAPGGGQGKAPPTAMPEPIEDYALIGDGETAALVSRRGSIDWLCLPRFDSPACFAALLGGPEHGRFGLAPRDGSRSVRRRYRDGTLVLETEFETADGAVTLVDCMPHREGPPLLIRQVIGRRGTVPMRMELVIRMDYGSVVPWVRRSAHGIHAVAGPDALALTTDLPIRGQDLTTVADFSVAAGERRSLTLQWYLSHRPAPAPLDPEAAVSETEAWWHRWLGRCGYEEGPDRAAVVRSLVTIKALIYEPTGGIVAAPTTSLPERLGGVRNWDYRICWVRDATFALYALVLGGYLEEARAWRQWLLRAVAGTPAQLQIMYGIGGERRLTEIELPWLPGYEGSAPVRIGNAAHAQFQLDVWGEMLDAAHAAERAGLERDPEGWRVIQKLMEHLEAVWSEPDEGIWEVRGPRRHFTHSKVMAWVAADRMVKMTEAAGHGSSSRWRALRTAIHADVCRRGLDPTRNAFVQSYGARELDASLLMIPLVGFLPPEDPRVRGTVAAIERELLVDGLVQRYPTRSGVDGLPPGEGVFLACSFWLVDNLVLQGRADEARRLFDRLLGLRNDVGLLAEQYDPRARRQLGNFPQALSHIALINSASNLSGALRPALHRAGR
jgi:GH15 family glucan-1,4-alpha-glucosidase